jgi:quinoprotein glucose dehydrogenase
MTKRNLVLSVAALCLLLSGVSWAQYGAPDGNWPHYAGDQGSTKYSALEQIDAGNFDEVEVLWRWTSPDSRLEEMTQFKPFHLRATPLVIDGVAYMSTGLSQVAAFEIETGDTLWVHDPKSYDRGMVTHGLFQHRGVEYWTDGTEERIVIATGGRQLVSLDAKTGLPDPNFADGGWVDLLGDLGKKVRGTHLGNNKPTVIIKDTIVVASIIMDFPSVQAGPPGHIRGYDVRTGELKWRFHSIPQEGEFGTETWENDSWKHTGNTNVWSMMTADPELGYIYLPFGAPTNDYYGGHRLGDNLFSQSLVCLDAETGERVWHFQAVHHGIWDYDFPCAPNLIDITVDGKAIKAVAQVSKQGFTFVFDRVTGKPVWPIEERPVDTNTTVPGERLSPTQPFPTKPPPFERQGVSEDDLIDFTPELRAEALELAKKYTLGPMFSPNIVMTDEKDGMLQLPGTIGGANWPGASIDPETGLLYVQSMTLPGIVGLLEPPDPNRSNLRYVINSVFTGNPNDSIESEAIGPQGLPLIKPPYFRITAIDLNKGDFAWQIPFGDGPRNHPAIKHLNLGPLGSRFPNTVWAEGGILVTKTLIITILADSDELGDRYARGSWLVALDKATGDEVGRIKVDRHLHSSPMTAMHNGRQYILVAGGGRTEPAEVLAFGLPQ